MKICFSSRYKQIRNEKQAESPYDVTLHPTRQMTKNDYKLLVHSTSDLRLTIFTE